MFILEFSEKADFINILEIFNIIIFCLTNKIFVIILQLFISPTDNLNNIYESYAILCSYSEFD